MWSTVSSTGDTLNCENGLTNFSKDTLVKRRNFFKTIFAGFVMQVSKYLTAIRNKLFRAKRVICVRIAILRFLPNFMNNGP